MHKNNRRDFLNKTAAASIGITVISQQTARAAPTNILSPLGTLMVIAGPKMAPLWQTPVLALMFIFFRYLQTILWELSRTVDYSF